MIKHLPLRVIDYLAAMACGALSLLLPALLVPADWPMLAAMSAGMALAMGAAFFITNLLAPIAGPFELMIPGMAISMTVGMLPVHMAGIGEHSFSAIALFGLAAGATVQGLFHIYDIFLHGEVKR